MTPTKSFNRCLLAAYAEVGKDKVQAIKNSNASRHLAAASSRWLLCGAATEAFVKHSAGQGKGAF